MEGWDGVTEVNSKVAGHSRSPLFPSPAAAGATLASHAVEGSDDEKQEAHADGHGHDRHAGLGSLGGHCRDGMGEEEGSAGRALSDPGAASSHPCSSSPEPKWKTCCFFPWVLEASQETPSLLRALVTFRVRELLTQPCPVRAGSAGYRCLG